MATSLHAFATNEHDLERVARFMGHDLAIHKSHYRLQDNAFDSTVMAAILLAFEENKVKRSDDDKQDFKKFLKDYVTEKHEDDSDVEEDVDDPEDPGTINHEIGKKIRTHFKTFINSEKKPGRNDVKPFLTILSNDFPEKEIKWTSIRNYVWNVVQSNKKKAKSGNQKEEKAKKAKAEEEEKAKKAKAEEEKPQKGKANKEKKSKGKKK